MKMAMAQLTRQPWVVGEVRKEEAGEEKEEEEEEEEALFFMHTALSRINCTKIFPFPAEGRRGKKSETRNKEFCSP